jgi:hypothetical protein
MSEFVISIAPAAGVNVPATAVPLAVEAQFLRSDPAAVDEAGKPLPPIVDISRGFVSDSLVGSLSLPEPVLGSDVEVRFLSGNGAIRHTRTLALPAQGNMATLDLTASDVAIVTAPEPRPQALPDFVLREAELVAVGDARVSFINSNLLVAPVTVAGAGWVSLGLDKLFNIPAPSTTAVSTTGQSWPQVGLQAWESTHLAVDGRFTAVFAKGAGDAWLWWLSGASPAIGLVVDDLHQARLGVVSLPLPIFAVSATDGESATAGDVTQPVPVDVTEREVAENPQIYTEDPGLFCKPFGNPERILGERSFNVIYRAEQPVVSAEATIETVTGPTLDFDLPESALRDGVRGSGTVTALAREVRPATGSVATLPDAVRASLLEPIVTRDELPPVILDDLRRAHRGRTLVDARRPVQWDADTSRYQSVTVVRGHILEFRMRWRSNGYSLGTVAKTLTLAPRQVRRIQKIEWQRVERTRREERTRLLDRVEDQVSRDRQYDDAVQASLSEWSRGESEASVTAAAGGFGFATGGFLIGGGGAHSNASSSASQEGGRRTTASEEQRLQDTIRRFGDSLRQLESVVVNEVTQEETVTGTAEIVRNANYAHSLTVIYYQILRHLKIETGFAGVRECLFVPFALKPFTVARAYRWRDLLIRGLLDRRYGSALRYLKDVLNGFVGSDVPPGRRSDQPIRHISGSLYLNIGVARPKDKDDGGFDEVAWTLLRPHLGAPAPAIFARLQELVEAQRDRYFQEQHAPRIAASWVDSLLLSAGSSPLPADFTLATRYQFNGAVRVDFSIPVGDGAAVTREMLSSIKVEATKDLPPGSVANLNRMTLTYQTDQFQRSFSTTPGTDDLISAETGARELAGAVIASIPDNWERRDVRAEITRAVNELIQHFNEHMEHYHKVIWWNMDRDRIFMLVDGFFVPGSNGVSIGSVIERDPIAIMGNSLVFRVSPGSFLGIDEMDTPEKLHNYYAAEQAVSEPLLVSLPTDGLYAQTIMDECAALEEHFGSIDWILSDTEPEVGEIAPELLATRRAEPQEMAPTPFPQTLINLQNAPEAPAPAGFAEIVGAVTNANAFRDMAGLAGTQANVRAGLETAAGLATQFAGRAADLKKVEMGTQTAKQKLDAIDTAREKKLIDDATAKRHAERTLDDMNTTQPGSPKLTLEPNVADFISGASQVTATRSDSDGVQTVEARREGGADIAIPALDLDLDKSLLGWTDLLRLVPEPFRTTLEERLARGREEWLTRNKALRRRFGEEPATNIDGLEIPPWIDRDQVFEQIRQHYDVQHAALTPADLGRPFSREPSRVLGADPSKPVTADYFVLHDTAGTAEPLDGAVPEPGAHMWIGTVSLARGRDWHEPGDATKLEGGNSPCFVHTELTRATSGAINASAPDNYPNDGISTARSARTRYTDQQYDDLANAYIVASIRRGRFLTVTAHKELDRSAVLRGHPNNLGHRDPEDLDLHRFYELVNRKLVMPLGSTYGITQDRIDTKNLRGQVNAFIEYARGNVAAANQYGAVPAQGPATSQGDATIPPYTSTSLYVLPLRDGAGNNVLNCGDGNWETGPV